MVVKMNKERMQELAKQAAEAIIKEPLNYDQWAKIANPTEIYELTTGEYQEYHDMIIVFMREIVKGGVSESNNQQRDDSQA
jgi:hypothetical protein